MIIRVVNNILRLIKILGALKGLYLYILIQLSNVSKKSPHLYYFFLHKKHRIILNYLSNISQKEIKVPPLKKKKELPDNIIWIFWWQGEECMPELVKACINSIKQHSGPYTPIILTKENINEYLFLPILENHKAKVSLTHLSDYIRLSVLHYYGGGWIDATIWLTKDIPDNIYNSSFFTIKHKQKPFFCVSEFRWGVSFLCCKKNNLLIEEVWKLFIKYWEYNTRLLDYFLMDYCFAYVIENNKECQEILNQVPYTNPQTYYGLALKLNQYFNNNEYQSLIADTWIHKLSYKIPIEEKENTFYKYIIHHYE